MIVVVGGHSRGIGKTSVVRGLIEALPEGRWTAVKITQHDHGICSTAGEPCEYGIQSDEAYALSEQKSADCTDSGKYLLAGARRAYWLRTAGGEINHAMPALGKILETSDNAILESNSILQFLRPDLYLAVADFSVSDLKDSSIRYIDRADAFVVIERGPVAPVWRGAVAKWINKKPHFPVIPPSYVTVELADFVRGRLWNGSA